MVADRAGHLGRKYLFLANAINYGWHTEASLFSDKPCDACRNIAQVCQR